MSSDIVATVFVHSLTRYGVRSVVIDRKLYLDIPKAYRHSTEGILHYIANRLILRRVKICLEEVRRGVLSGFYKGVYVLHPLRRSIASDAYITGQDASCGNDLSDSLRELMLSLLPMFPLFIIDLSLWELHHEKEKRSLLKQLVVSINTVRMWLTDLHIVLSSTPSEVLDKIRNVIPSALRSYIDAEVYEELAPSRTVVLDPSAEDVLTERDVFRYDYYVIGGINDRLYPRPFATYMIYKMHSLNVDRKSIKLRGSIVGIPKEINKIINIILAVRLGGKSLDRAIVENMSIDDKIKRVVYELSLILRNSGKIDLDTVNSIAGKYGLNKSHLGKVLSKVKSLS